MKWALLFLFLAAAAFADGPQRFRNPDLTPYPAEDIDKEITILRKKLSEEKQRPIELEEKTGKKVTGYFRMSTDIPMVWFMTTSKAKPDEHRFEVDWSSSEVAYTGDVVKKARARIKKLYDLKNQLLMKEEERDNVMKKWRDENHQKMREQRPEKMPKPRNDRATPAEIG